METSPLTHNTPALDPTSGTPIQKSFPLKPVLTFITVASMILSAVFIYQNWLLNQKLQQLISDQRVVTPTPQVLVPPTDPTANWKTFSVSKYAYEFKYPSNLTIYDEIGRFVNLTSIPVCDPLVKTCLYIPQEMYPGTNFKGAGLGVDILSASSEKLCLSQNMTNNLGEKTINGNKFQVYTKGGAAAGNQSVDYSYFTFQNNKCFQITGRITTDSSDVNAPAGTVKTFTESQRGTVIELFENILSTFKFSENTPGSDKPVVDDPVPNSNITSPVKVMGKIPRSWTFEANFIIEIQNDKRIPLNSTPVYAKFASETDELASFSTSLTFLANSSSGFVIIKSDNPSGLPENQKTFEIPVRFK